MSRLRYNRREAVRHLKARCPRMARVIRDQGPFTLRVHKDRDLFTALASSIAYQQLSGKAAATIYGRFEALFEDKRPRADRVAEMPVDVLRSVGLSNNKALSIIDLARHCVSGQLPGARRLAAMDDETVIERLCAVRGIGPWTVQMYLMFSLGRPDVMPSTDLGIQKAVQLTWGLPALPAPDEVVARTGHLAPYRSVASWYLWRVVDD